MERNWKLGDDLRGEDNLLDPITFDELVLTLHCNARTINEKAARRELREIMTSRVQDLEFLLENNMEEILRAAKEGRDTECADCHNSTNEVSAKEGREC